MARRVTWTNNSTDYDGTNIYRDTTIDPQNLPAPLATVGPAAQGATVEYIDLTGNGDQCYAVRDFDSSDNGALSEAYCFELPGYVWSSTDISGIELSNDDLTATKISGTRAGAGAEAESAKASGAWYWEYEIVSQSGNFLACGLSKSGSNRTINLGQGADAYGYHAEGSRYFDGSFGGDVYAPYSTGDVIGVAFDIDSETIEFTLNNVSQGVESVTLDAASYLPAMSADSDGDSITLRTTESEFSYSIPAGFSALA